MPKRIQLSRRRGWKIKDHTSNPNGYAIVDRRSKWGNPYKVEKRRRGHYRVLLLGMPLAEFHLRSEANKKAVEYYAQFLDEKLELEPDWLEPLRGKDLFCWCHHKNTCHADVLLELANKEANDGNETNV